MASIQLDTSSDLTELENHHPELAKTFKSLRDEISSPRLDQKENWNKSSIDIVASIAHRQAAGEEFDGLIDRIRALDGFENFLLPLSGDELMELGADGPIITFNISSLRSDAFLITKNRIHCLHLPTLRFADLESRCSSFTDLMSRLSTANYYSINLAVQRILEWLWDVAVGPILDELGFTEEPKPGDQWPHVWWIPCGLLNILPIHAAGYHMHSKQNALDRVISSYSPTIKALAYSRNRTPLSSQISELLLVSMPDTPNQTPLPNSRAEVQELRKLFAPSIKTSVLELPRKNDVLSELGSCHIAHFACHGNSSINNPSESHLLLHDWNVNPLTVADVVALNLGNTHLVYISACHAAVGRVTRLYDEAIHMAGAFQLAGVSQVVGTLWHIDDYAAVGISRECYQTLLTKSGQIDLKLVAQGLHRAVRRVRQENLSGPSSRRRRECNPLIWAPYIHMGG